MLLLLNSCSGAGSGTNDVLFVNTAPDLNAELELDGRPGRVVISPDGQLWLGTGVGQIAVGDSVNASWRHVMNPPMHHDWARAMASRWPSVSHVAFFAPDTVIAMGLGGELHRSVDGGETWEEIAFGDASFIDATFSLRSGRAWIGGGAFIDRAALFTTYDYGATWHALPAPFDSRVSSIHMESAEVGVVAGLWNRLARTTDGGRTWTAMATPFDQGVVPEVPGDNQHVLDAVSVVGDRIVVRQGDRVFHSPRDVIAWSPLPGDVRHFAWDSEDGRLYGLSHSGEVLTYGDALNPVSFGQARSHGFPIHMAAHAGRVVVLEREGALLEVRGTRSQYGFPLSDQPHWRMVKVRAAGDRIWGVSRHQIYTSLDTGQTWNRVGFTPTAIRSFLVRSNGDLLLWDGHGRNVIYDPAEGTLRPVASLLGYDIVDVLRVGSTWVAFGGRQYETMGRVEVGRTYFAGQFEGSRENGFVLVSEDEGETWRRIDEWPDGGVANMFTDPTLASMTLVSYLGGVRQLHRTDAGYTGTDVILPSSDTWQAVPYVEVPSVVYFEDARHGYIDGWIHHLGERRYTTSDGGRSWQEVPVAEHDILAVPAPGGYVVMRGSEMDGGTELVYRTGSHEVSIWRPEPPARSADEYSWMGITDVSIDDRGRIIAVVDGTDIVILELPSGTPKP